MRIIPTRRNYNESLQNSDKELLLLNIVRLRYSDPIYLLTVNNIISQINYSNTIGGGVANGWIPFPPTFASNANESLTTSEGPTITYTPIQGDAFIRKMMTPIRLEIIYALITSFDARFDCILRLLFNSVGPFTNMPAGEVNDKQKLSKAKDFQVMASVLQHLAETSNLIIQHDTVKKVFAIKLSIMHFDKLTPKERSIVTQLGLTKRTPSVWITLDPETTTATPQKANGISIESKKLIEAKPRTLFAVMHLLSRSVELPAGDQERNIVLTSKNANGQLVDWRYFTNNLMTIRSSTRTPRNSFVSVKYRGRWFYMSDNDTESKTTLFLFSTLLNIYDGNVQSGLSPVFSILK